MQNTAYSTFGVPFKPHLNLMFSGHTEVTSVIKLQTRKPNREVCSYLESIRIDDKGFTLCCTPPKIISSHYIVLNRADFCHRFL